MTIETTPHTTPDTTSTAGAIYEPPDYVTHIEDRFGFVDVHFRCIGGADFTHRLPLLRVHMVGPQITLYVCDVAQPGEPEHGMTFWPSEIIREIAPAWRPSMGEPA